MWKSAMTWIGTALDLLGEPLVIIAGTPVSPATVIVVVAVLIVTWASSRAARRGTEQAMARYGIDDDGTVRVTQRLVHYMVMAMGFGVALQTAGIDLSALFAAGAVFAVGFGFAMQNIVQNFVSGLILLVERSIRPGDILEVEGEIVRVVDLGIRATRVHTRDADDLLIPNSVLVQNTVRNLTSGSSHHRIKVVVGVAYESDLDVVFSVLEAVAAQQTHPDGPAPEVRLASFGSSSIDFEVFTWVLDSWNENGARSNVRRAIHGAFKGRGVVIAFPQLDLHVKDVVAPADSLRSV